MSGNNPRPLIVANWKMQLTNSEAVTLASRIVQKIIPTATADVVLCPSYVALPQVQQELKALQSSKRHHVSLGAQNVSQYERGAYTGEVSAEQLEGLVSYVIDGHSERRLNFGETSEVDGSKLAQALRHGLKPILCVGETVLEREQSLTSRVVVDQLEAGLSHVTSSDLSEVAIAYEPVWAIGSGELPRPGDVAAVARDINDFLANRYAGVELPRVLYGGSVSASNAAAYLDIPQINGLLIGGASLNYIEFAKIVNLTVKKA